MTDNPHQSAYGTGIAQAYGEGATATVNITGLNPEQIATLLQAAGAAAQGKIDELAVHLNASREAVQGFLKILKEDEGPIEQLPAKLTLIAQRHVSMLEHLAALDPEDPEAQSHIDEAREVLRQAASTKDYDRADELLFTAEDAQDRSLREAEALEREAHEAARRLRRGKAATRAERGELSLTRLDYLQAARHFQAAASLVASEDLNLKLDYRTRSADALSTHGDEKGENGILAQAIDVYREVLSELIHESMPLKWAVAQNNLGNALGTLGERESGTGRLEEAVAAYREALKECTRERVPLDWAAIQNNLGNALGRLGQRESGTGRLEEAVAAYRGALEERTRERVPLDWAATHNNLGFALQRLGERESGKGRLEEAVAAFREALKEGSRERVPLDWAATQNNLGFALKRLGERESGTGRLEEAVAAYREALKEYTRERVPLDWAMTQNNLGLALQALGERESGTGRLEEARGAIGLAWGAYQEAGIRQYDAWFETRLKAIDDLIASRR